jgi:ribose transport system permease protein
VNPVSYQSAVRIPPATIRTSGRFLRAALPALSLALVILGIAWLNPRAIS